VGGDDKNWEGREGGVGDDREGKGEVVGRMKETDRAR